MISSNFTHPSLYHEYFLLEIPEMCVLISQDQVCSKKTLIWKVITWPERDKLITHILKKLSIFAKERIIFTDKSLKVNGPHKYFTSS